MNLATQIKVQSMHRVLLFFISAIIFLQFTACSTTRMYKGGADGPPSYIVDESRIPNAVPKPEPLSKYGNRPNYRVLGHRYYVLKSAKGFHQRGIASWYGTKFHSHYTSNREPYNMLAMTAAHKTLPLPTYVKVTNLRNHRQIIVRVNDRGPFAANRIIDLSYVAAKKLGMLGTGTAPVQLDAIDPYDRRQLTQPPAPPISHAGLRAQNFHQNRDQVNNSFRSPTVKQASGNTFLQVGTYSTQAKAQLMVNRILQTTHTNSRIMPINVGRRRLYRVQVGPLANIDHSNLYQKLQSLGVGQTITVRG